MPITVIKLVLLPHIETVNETKFITTIVKVNLNSCSGHFNQTETESKSVIRLDNIIRTFPKKNF